MAGKDNLRALTTEQAREIGRKGGLASAEVRKRKKTIYELTATMLEAPVDGRRTRSIKSLVKDMSEDDMTVNAAMIAGQIKSAIDGNTKAFQALVDIQGKARRPDIDHREWTIPITDITSDFVEPYRAVHEAFTGDNNLREVVSKGGRGSIKSNFWAAVAYETIRNDPQAHVVYTRRYKTDLRGSVYNQFMKTVIRYKDLDNWDFKVSPMMAVYKRTGQCVIFVGADKPISL